MSRFYEEMKHMQSSRIFIITGAPGSGKTTYAKANRRTGDIVIDLDYLASALMLESNPHTDRQDVLDAAFFIRKQLIDAIESNSIIYNRAFIIATNDAQKLQHRLGGTIIDCDKGFTDTFDRIKNDDSTSDEQQKKRREYALAYYRKHGKRFC